MASPSNSLRLTLQLGLLVAAAAMMSLHGIHLLADFPNHSPWMDWSKYTDEGWYGDAAIRFYQLGHWYVPGDFNPAVALPVWPLLEALLFHFTGVSLVAVRALTVGVLWAILLCGWLLLARGPRPNERAPLAAAAALVLLATSPFCFVFTRLAILEPMLILLTLIALLTARSLKAEAGLRGNALRIVALGVLLPAMILTKTTAMFLLPAVAWMIFAAARYRWRTLLRLGLPVGAIAATLWLAYFLLLVRPHYLLDYRYLFSANAYTGMTRENFLQVLLDTVRDGMWMGPVLYPAALAAVVVALFRWPEWRQNPTIISLILWSAGYTAFLAYHNNLQPRYYLVVAVPLTLLLPLVLSRLVVPWFPRVLGAAAAVLLAGIAVPDALETIHYLRTPEYTLVHVAEQVQDVIREQQAADPTHNPLVLSISGSELSLITGTHGLHSIDDDFGTLELADRVQKYRPGWYVAWNQIDDDKMDAMTPLFHLERVAAFPAMDDPDRNLLIVYRLDPASPTHPPHRKRKPTPRPLVTKVGQQPSTTQLEH